MRLLSLASGVLPEHPAETVVEAAAAAGYPACGIRVEPEDWSNARVRDLGRRIADHGLVLLDLEVLWIRDEPLQPGLFRMIDIAAALGARNLLAVCSDPGVESGAAKFGALCDRAARHGLTVSLEFGRFTLVPDLATALRLIGAADRPNARLLVDALHLSRSGGHPAEIAGVPPALFSYGQLCDAGPVPPPPDDLSAIRAEALDGRLLPGEGVLPLRALLAHWPAGLPLSIELRSEALRAAFPDPVQRARHVLKTSRAWLATAEPEESA